MILTFHQPPVVPVAAQPDHELMKAAIEAAYNPFPPNVAAQALLVTQWDLAMKMMADSQWFFTPEAAHGWLQSATRVGAAGVLTVAAEYIDLPTHWKGVVSQTIAVTVCMTVASYLGFKYHGSLRAIEARCAYLGMAPICGVAWLGHFGPDYLAINPDTNGTVLLESKGVSSAAVGNKPKEFANHKVQSVNGWATALQAHVLAYTYLAPGAALTARWYNNRPPEQLGGTPRALLVIATLQLITELKHCGHPDWADLMDAAFRAGGGPVEAGQLMYEYLVGQDAFELQGGYLISRRQRPFTMAMRIASLQLFFTIAGEHNWLVHDDAATNLAAGVREIHGQREIVREELANLQGVHEVMGVSSTGLAIVQIC